MLGGLAAKAVVVGALGLSGLGIAAVVPTTPTAQAMPITNFKECGYGYGGCYAPPPPPCGCGGGGYYGGGGYGYGGGYGPFPFGGPGIGFNLNGGWNRLGPW